MDGGKYLWGVSPEEISRLRFQHRVWAETENALWRRAGFTVNQTIADVGCGPGYSSLAMAELVGLKGSIHCYDISDAFLDFLKASADANRYENVKTYQADVNAKGWAKRSGEQWDGAYCRLLLWNLPDASNLISEVKSALRPGGTFAVFDWFNHHFEMVPSSPYFQKIVSAIEEAVNMTGGNVHVQKQTPVLLRDAGFEIEELTLINRIVYPGSPMWEWIKVSYDLFLERLKELKLISDADQVGFQSEWIERSGQACSFIRTADFLDVVAKKPN